VREVHPIIIFWDFFSVLFKREKSKKILADQIIFLEIGNDEIT